MALRSTLGVARFAGLPLAQIEAPIGAPGDARGVEAWPAALLAGAAGPGTVTIACALSAVAVARKAAAGVDRPKGSGRTCCDAGPS